MRDTLFISVSINPVSAFSKDENFTVEEKYCLLWSIRILNDMHLATAYCDYKLLRSLSHLCYVNPKHSCCDRECLRNINIKLSQYLTLYSASCSYHKFKRSSYCTIEHSFQRLYMHSKQPCNKLNQWNWQTFERCFILIDCMIFYKYFSLSKSLRNAKYFKNWKIVNASTKVSLYIIECCNFAP